MKAGIAERMGRRLSALPLALFVFAACATPPPPLPPAAPPPPAALPPPAPSAEPSTTAPAEPSDWPHQHPLVVRATGGMVVTDNAVATAVGRDVLASGGNAADAAVAVAFALAVTYPTAGNLGGGGFAVARIGGDLRALDFRETAPAAATPARYLGPDGKAKPDVREGIRSAGVPGSVAGLYELYQKLGSKRKSWAALLAPAIRLAEEGFVVDEPFVASLEFARTRLSKHPASAALFLPNGAPPPLGSTWKNPDLAATLRRIEQGPRGFYEGPTATALVAQMKREGGFITLADLKKYRAKWREPLKFSYRGHEIASMPPPSSGGVTMAMIAHILERYELGKLGFQTPASLHYLFEAMRRAYAARNARLGDPDFVKMPLDELLSPAWADAERATIQPDRATPSSEIVAAPASASGPHTTNFCVVDANGDAVSLTTTVNWWFGSGVTVAGAGFVLNNEMDDFAAVPGTPNGFGLVQGEANAIAPGKRMLSSMSPTLVFAPSGELLLVAGGAGGPTIISTVFQEISNVLDFGLDVGAAVAAPRFHMQHLPDEVVYEEHGLPPRLRASLEAMGYSFRERPHIADAPAIGRLGREWLGAAEPRRKGALAAAP